MVANFFVHCGGAPPQGQSQRRIRCLLSCQVISHPAHGPRCCPASPWWFVPPSAWICLVRGSLCAVYWFSCQHNKLHLPDLAEQLIRHSRQLMCFGRAVWMKLKACISRKFIRYARYAIAPVWNNATWKWMQCLLDQNSAFLANDITLLWDACNWTPP